jgi:hypothetical protein
MNDSEWIVSTYAEYECIRHIMKAKPRLMDAYLRRKRPPLPREPPLFPIFNDR